MSDESGDGQANTNTDGDDGQTDGASGEGQTEGQEQQQAGSEGQDGDTGATDGNDGGGDTEGGDGDPITYEFTAPEGMELDQSLVDAATPVFQELGLTQEQADKLVGVYADRLQAQAQDAEQAFSDQLESWATELKNDKDFGGDKFEENAAIARSAIDKFGSDELRELLDSTGVGNHPAMVRFAHAIGRLVSEDQPGVGSKSGSTSSREERMYPDMAQSN
jgi:hypothetical protein